MAVLLLRVLVLGVIAAAADDVPVKWVAPGRVLLPCAVPGAVGARRPPPPLEPEDRARHLPYVWRRDQQILHNVLWNGSLEVSLGAGGAGGEGVYQCTYSHRAGPLLGYPLHLKLAYMDEEFSAAPANTSAALGQPLVLRCHIGSGPAPHYAWLRDGRALPAHHRYFTLDNQLLILDVQEEDAGLYSCRASNSVLNETRTSGAGRVAVEARALPAGLEPAGLLPLDLPRHLAAPRGSSLVLPCPVTGSPKPKVSWRVRERSGRRSELEHAREVLELRDLQPADEGLYSCALEDSPHLQQWFNVSVTEAAVIVVPPASKQSLPASTVRFNCTAAGRPAPRVAWYKDGLPLMLTGRNVMLSSVDSKRIELLIRSVTSDDAGVYQCFAWGGGGAASAWARLDVTGEQTAAPQHVRCQPAAAARVLVRWRAVPGNVTAYTVHYNPPGGTSLPSLPTTFTEQIINVGEPLTPYEFQVRAYIRSERTNKSLASNMSETVVCQGQGVPIKLVRLGGDAVAVSWQQFAAARGAAQWRVQHRAHHAAAHTDVPLPPHQHNYTLAVPRDSPLQVRVLGTRTLPWLQQNLTLVPWTSTSAASNWPDDGGVQAVPQDVEVTAVGARDFTVRWRCDGAEQQPEPYSYMVCTRKVDGNEDCVESTALSLTVSGLQPASEYSVRVQARVPGRLLGGDFSKPIHISTQPEGPQRFKDLTYKLVNSTTLRVSWNSVPDEYKVHYSDELELPIHQWATVEVNGNTVLLSELDLTRELYVMVSGYEPVGHSSIVTIPAQMSEARVSYAAVRGGVRVWWGARGPRLVHYSQNITQPLHAWQVLNVTSADVTITGLDPSKPTYVIVAPPGVSQRNQVITIEPQPQDNSSVYLSVGIVTPLILLCLLATAAVFLWRKRKRSRSPLRSRRRNTSPGEGTEEEGSEMKGGAAEVSPPPAPPCPPRHQHAQGVVTQALAARLANGGGKDAGEPLLNGHVHITENPSSKTPNGKMRKGRRYECPLDVSRRPEERAASPAPSAAHCEPLDTSRAPPAHPAHPAHPAATDKLPDDNMNSQVRRTSAAPTLQPNG